MVDRLADFFAEDFFALDFFVDFLEDFFAGIVSPPLKDAHDAIRFRRRRSRSLIPPHTPYRSSRRRA